MTKEQKQRCLADIIFENLFRREIHLAPGLFNSVEKELKNMRLQRWKIKECLWSYRRQTLTMTKERLRVYIIKNPITIYNNPSRSNYVRSEEQNVL